MVTPALCHYLQADEEKDTTLRGATWSLIEAELAITCACLPTLRPIFSKTDRMMKTMNGLGMFSLSPSVNRHAAKQDSWNDRVISIKASDDPDQENRSSPSRGTINSQGSFDRGEERVLTVADGTSKTIAEARPEYSGV